MKIDQLPQEIISQVVNTAELSPLSLLRLGKTLTRQNNNLSAAALDDQAWKNWSSKALRAEVPHLSLSAAFQQRWSKKSHVDRLQLQHLYRAFEQDPSGVSIEETATSQDMDVQIAMLQIAMAQDSYPDITSKVSMVALCEPRIVLRLLSDRLWLEQMLPHHIFTFHDYCTLEKIEIPKISMSDVIWRQYLPEVDSQSVGTTSFYERAKERWNSKSPRIQAAIAQASEDYRLNNPLSDYRPLDTSDFELMMAKCAHDGRFLEYSDEPLLDDRNLVLRAMQRNGYGLFHWLSPRLRDDDAIVRTAMEEAGAVLEDASERLRNDMDLVKLACRGRASNIQCASDEFLQNVDLVLEVIYGVKQKALYYHHLPEPMQRETRILAILTSYLQDKLKNGTPLNLEESPELWMEYPEECMIGDEEGFLLTLGVPADAVGPMTRAIMNADAALI